MSNLIDAFDSLMSTKGATLNIETGELNPDDGYMASRHGFEKRFPATADLNKFQDYVIGYMNKAFFDEVLGKPNAYLGCWEHDGELYLDVTYRFNLKDQAMRFGEKNKQIAIYGNKEKKVFFIKDYSTNLLKGLLSGISIIFGIYLIILLAAIGYYWLLKYHLV